MNAYEMNNYFTARLNQFERIREHGQTVEQACRTMATNRVALSTCTGCGRSMTPLVFSQHHCGDVVRDFVLVIPLAVPRRVFRAHEQDSYREKVIAGRCDAA